MCEALGGTPIRSMVLSCRTASSSVTSVRYRATRSTHRPGGPSGRAQGAGASQGPRSCLSLKVIPRRAWSGGHGRTLPGTQDKEAARRSRVPRSILYDNTTLAVARILGDGTRRRTQAFTHLQSHYLFRDRFGRPGKGNDKGKVEALVKTARRRFMVPIPKVHDLSVPERAADGALPGAARRAGGRRPGDGIVGRPRRLARFPGFSLRGLRACAGPDLVHGPGALPAGGLLGADGARPQEGHGEGAMSTGSRSRSAPRSSPAIGAPMSAATSSTTRCTICRCWRRSRAPWTRRRRCGDGSSIPPSTRCAASSKPASARAASANTSRCCACTKTSRNAKWRPRCATR